MGKHNKKEWNELTSTGILGLLKQEIKKEEKKKKKKEEELKKQHILYSENPKLEKLFVTKGEDIATLAMYQPIQNLAKLYDCTYSEMREAIRRYNVIQWPIKGREFGGVLFYPYAPRACQEGTHKVYLLEFTDGCYYIGHTSMKMRQRLQKWNGERNYNDEVNKRELKRVYTRAVDSKDDAELLERQLIHYALNSETKDKCLNKTESFHPVRGIKTEGGWVHDFPSLSAANEYINSCGFNGDYRSRIKGAAKTNGERELCGFRWYEIN